MKPLQMGQKAEREFKELALKRGFNVKHATKRQDMQEHWDFLLDNGAETIKVDVKAKKRIRRHDRDAQSDWVWIELHGVRPDNRGWLYGGIADYIAFEVDGAFVLVRRVHLIAVVERLVDFTEVAFSAQTAQFKVYGRRGRYDKLTLIPASAIKAIAWDTWSKQDDQT